MTFYQYKIKKVADLIPYANNARTHSDEQIAQLAASIKEFGFTNPILIDEADGIIAGHGRLLAALKLKMKEVPVIEVTGLDDISKRALIIADNKLALNAGWDEQLLTLELQSLGDAVQLTGFSQDELTELLKPANLNTNAELSTDLDEDETLPEVPAEPVTKTGDLWKVGKHFLICGNSTDPNCIKSLMLDQTASLCFTSPPYANQRDYKSGGISDWDALMQGVFANMPLTDNGQILVNLGLVHKDSEVMPYWDNWIAYMKQHWRFYGWYVWDQGPGMPGASHGRLASSHEFIFHFNSKARPAKKIVPCKMAGEIHSGNAGHRKADGEIQGYGGSGKAIQEYKIPDTVIRIIRQKGSIGDGIDHPAVFPIGLPLQMIQAYTDEAERVFEPFCGSGTTMLACEVSNRVCHSVELAPEYTDVAIKRFMQKFPQQSVILMETGETFEQVAAYRIK